MTTYVGGSIDKVHIAERKTAEHLERLARQAISELGIGIVLGALDISQDRLTLMLAERDWTLLRGLRVCFLLGALDPRVFERAVAEATDPDLMIRHLPTIPPDIPYTPPPTHTLPATSGPGPVTITPTAPIPGGMVTAPPFAPSPTTATASTPGPVVLSAPTAATPPPPLYRVDSIGLLTHILNYQMADVETVSFTPPELPEPELMMDGTVLAPTLPRPTHTYVELILRHVGLTRSHPYPNEDVGRLAVLLKQFRDRAGWGPTLRASS